MSVARLITVVVVLVCLAGVLAPLLIDGHHWWPRRRKN